MPWMKVCPLEQVAQGSMARFRVEGKDILLARVEGKYYGLEDRCPHMGCSLSRGSLEDGVVTCPCHGSQFRVQDGGLARWAQGLTGRLSRPFFRPRPARSFQTKLEGQYVLVEV